MFSCLFLFSTLALCICLNRIEVYLLITIYVRCLIRSFIAFLVLSLAHFMTMRYFMFHQINEDSILFYSILFLSIHFYSILIYSFLFSLVHLLLIDLAVRSLLFSHWFIYFLLVQPFVHWFLHYVIDSFVLSLVHF